MTDRADNRPPTDSSRSTAHRLDPAGKRALFEAPPAAARDTLGPGPAKEGRAALFSGPAGTGGTVGVSCSSCEVTTRVSRVDLGLRLVTGSVWLPLRSHPHWLRCPACARRTWCALS